MPSVSKSSSSLSSMRQTPKQTLAKSHLQSDSCSIKPLKQTLAEFFAISFFHLTLSCCPVILCISMLSNFRSYVPFQFPKFSYPKRNPIPSQEKHIQEGKGTASYADLETR
jgi:hypothetical protein